MRMVRQPAEPPRIIRGIRLSRDPELNGGGIKKVLSRAGTTIIAGGKKEQDLSSSATSLCVHRSRKDGPRVDVRRSNDRERLRAVAAPIRVLDAGDLRLRTPNSTDINLGPRYSNNPRLGEGRGRVGRHGRRLHRRSFLGRQPLPLLLPEPTLAATVNTMAWRTTSGGHDILQLGPGAHAHLRAGEFASSCIRSRSPKPPRRESTARQPS